MSILDVSFQSLVVMIEHGTSLIIEPGVMMRISWHTTPKWTRPMSRSKIQTRCHFLHSSCSEIKGFRLWSLKPNYNSSKNVYHIYLQAVNMQGRFVRGKLPRLVLHQSVACTWWCYLETIQKYGLDAISSTTLALKLKVSVVKLGPI